MVFGYMSLGLVIAALLRSQFRCLQKIFIPSSILAGFIFLLLGPGLLGIVNVSREGAGALVYIFLTSLFIILGLRGFRSGSGKRDLAITTVLLTKGLALMAAVGLLFTFVLTALLKADYFAGFGSLLMLGYGYDPAVAQIFGGYWEQSMGFAGGSAIGYSFGVLGFLFSYILGLVMIAWVACKREKPLFEQAGDRSFLTGFLPAALRKPSGDKTTTDPQTIDTLAFHLAVVGAALLITLSLIRLIGFLLIKRFGTPAVEVVEVLMNYQYLVGFALGVAIRKILERFNVSHILERGSLGRLLGVLVDYTVVGAIISIPLVISRVHLWGVLALAVAGALLIFFAVLFITRFFCRGDELLEKQVAIFGFLLGNIASSVVLLRVLDPRLEKPVIGQVALASALVVVTGLPLIYLINLPLIGQEHIYFAYAIIGVIIYGALYYLAWHFLLRENKAVK